MIKIWKILDRLIEWMISIVLILMVIVGGIQVFNRFVLNQSLSWSEEFQRYAHIWLIFLTIPVAFQRDSHIGLRVIFDKFPANLRQSMTVAFDVLWLLFSLALIYTTWVIMDVTRTQHSAGLGIRMDRVYLGLEIGGFYLFIVALRKISDHLQRPLARFKGAPPC